MKPLKAPLTRCSGLLQVVVHNRPGAIVQDRINLFTLDFLNPALESDQPSFKFTGAKRTYTIKGARVHAQGCWETQQSSGMWLC